MGMGRDENKILYSLNVYTLYRHLSGELDTFTTEANLAKLISYDVGNAHPRVKLSPM